MKNLLPANRVVLLLHLVFVIATAAGIFIASISHSLPLSWQANVAGGATILGALAAATVAVTKFLDGSQKSEALGASNPAPPTAVASVVGSGAPVSTEGNLAYASPAPESGVLIPPANDPAPATPLPDAVPAVETTPAPPPGIPPA
jgi:hypothetical protein